MRIAVFIKSTTFHKNFGGLETQNKGLCEGLAKRDHDITVFSPARELGIPGIKDKGVKYIFLDCVYRTMPFSFSKLNWAEKSYREFKKIHFQKRFDLVISQSSAGRGIINHKKELKIKVISISHGSILSELRTKILNSSMLKDYLLLLKDLAYVLINYFTIQRNFILHSDKIIAVSNTVKKTIVDETFVSEDKVVVIYNGIDGLDFPSDRSNRLCEKPKIIYIGRVIKSKGLFVLIKAIENIQHKNFLLRIVGNGDDLEKLKAYVVKNNLNEWVRFAGQLPYQDIKKEFLDSDIFVLPSLRIEGFPMTLIEAMCAGLSIVASQIGGIPDAVDDGLTGLLVKPGDVKDLREKLEHLLKNKEERLFLGRNAKIKAEKDFNINIMLDKYEKVFKEIS